MFKMSYGLMLVGFVLFFFAWLLMLLFGWFFISIILSMFMMVAACIIILLSLLRIHLDVLNSTLYYLIEEPKKGCVNWLFVGHDGEMVVLQAVKRAERFSANSKLGQQIRETRTYRFCGHTVRIVGDGLATSIDLGACLKIHQLKREYKVKNIFQIRKIFRPSLNEENEIQQEEITSLEEGQKAAGIIPISPTEVPEVPKAAGPEVPKGA